jgi:hypothetical protein
MPSIARKSAAIQQFYALSSGEEIQKQIKAAHESQRRNFSLERAAAGSTGRATRAQRRKDTFD